MEEFYSPVWQEYLGGVSGIVFTIIIILLFVFTFRYLRKSLFRPLLRPKFRRHRMNCRQSKPHNQNRY